MKHTKESMTPIYFAIFTLICLLLGSPALASKKNSSFLRIPVFFITDRNLVPPTKKDPDAIAFGPHRKYIFDCQHDSFMGIAYSVIENIDNKPITKELADLGWEEAQPKDKEGTYKATLIKADNFDSIEKEFYGKVHEKTLLTPDKNIFLFAHGYKNSFQSALHTATRIAYHAERPIIFYSWPSVCKLRSYTSDENNVEWSQEHFNDVITHLESLCTEDPSVKIRLYSHSMGTRLVVRACPLLRARPWLAEAVLICPDIDDGLVQHYAKRYLSKDGTATIRVYMSQGDKCLALSQLLHGGYCRFGECATSLSGWATQALTGNNQISAEPDAAQAAAYAEVLKKLQTRMQTIDFTAIDSGILGHKIPARLVCSMSFTNHPCEGLKLVPEESGERSKLSHFLSRATKLAAKNATNEISIKGTCLRVVPDDTKHQKQLAKALDSH